MDSKTPGRFVTVEGIEGVGKSTHIEAIQQHLNQQGIDVLVTREPGGTELGEAIRGLLLSSRSSPMDVYAELCLVFAARAQHLDEVLRPALRAGRWVVCDRFTDASYAYQGGGRGIPKERIAQLERWVQGGFRPDLTILLDADVRVGLSRAKNRGPADRFEQETIAFFERVRASYRLLAESDPNRVKLVAADAPLEVVQSRVLQLLQRLVTGWTRP
jgi:dTMP kinase